MGVTGNTSPMCHRLRLHIIVQSSPENKGVGMRLNLAVKLQDPWTNPKLNPENCINYTKITKQYFSISKINGQRLKVTESSETH